MWEAAFIPTCCVHTLRSRLMGILALQLQRCLSRAGKGISCCFRHFRMNGKVRGMKAQGDITVDFEWREGRIHRVRLCSSREQKVTLECNGISKTVFLKPDGTEDMIFD